MLKISNLRFVALSYVMFRSILLWFCCHGIQTCYMSYKMSSLHSLLSSISIKAVNVNFSKNLCVIVTNTVSSWHGLLFCIINAIACHKLFSLCFSGLVQRLILSRNYYWIWSVCGSVGPATCNCRVVIIIQTQTFIFLIDYNIRENYNCLLLIKCVFKIITIFI